VESSILWAFLAFLALGGWAVDLYLRARVQQSQANALMILDKVDERMNERLEKLVARVREQLLKAQPKVPSAVPKPAPASNPVDTRMQQIFGDSGLVDQPDADDTDLETVDA
jgi:endonuclease/exonuclease/phosphatase (EEP) superfamily protein YafD